MNFKLFSIILILFVIHENIYCKRVSLGDDENDDAIDNDDDETSVNEKSRKEYELLIKDSEKYGLCWINAIEELRSSCNKITEEKQSRLAFLFTNCFLEKMNLPTYNCYEDKATEADCMKSMSERAFNVYTHYFTHTQSICFFLVNQLWQARTKNLISKLSSTIGNIDTDINKLNTVNEQLQLRLTESSSAIANFHEKLSGQTQNFFDIRDLVLNELSKGYTIIFYILSLISVHFLTSTTRTAQARLPLYIIVLLNVLAERIITTYSLELDEESVDILAKKVKLESFIWLARKVSAILGLFVLMLCSLNYRDYNQINNQLLREIREQNDKIIRHFDTTNLLQAFLSPAYLDNYNEESDEDFLPEMTEDELDEIEEEKTKEVGNLAVTPMAPIRRYNTRSHSKVFH